MIEHRPVTKSLHERQAETIAALIEACEGLIERLDDAWPQSEKDKAAIDKAHAALRTVEP